VDGPIIAPCCRDLLPVSALLVSAHLSWFCITWGWECLWSCEEL